MWIQFRGWVGLTAELVADVAEIVRTASIPEVDAEITTKGIIVNSLNDWEPTIHIKPAVNHRADNDFDVDPGDYQELVCAILLRIKESCKVTIGTDRQLANYPEWEGARDLYRMALNREPGHIS